MPNSRAPRWLQKLERTLGWVAVPNLAVILVTLQGFGFLFVMIDPIWAARLALLPGAVSRGEFWRVITFLALPLSMSPIWVIFVLWFLYFIVNAVESLWGAFYTTLYVLVTWLVTVVFSCATGYPILSASDFQSTLFLAAASLFPETEIQLFFFVPVKLKWLGWLTLAYVGYRFALGDWGDRFYLLSIYSAYLIFFGPALAASAKQALRRWNYKRKL